MPKKFPAAPTGTAIRFSLASKPLDSPGTVRVRVGKSVMWHSFGNTLPFKCLNFETRTEKVNFYQYQLINFKILTVYKNIKETYLYVEFKH